MKQANLSAVAVLRLLVYIAAWAFIDIAIGHYAFLAGARSPFRTTAAIVGGGMFNIMMLWYLPKFRASLLDK
jgi:hypothetical protein